MDKSHKKQMCGIKACAFVVQNCVRQAWGCDPNRLCFLYSSTVEPILTYGCAIWSAALQRKQNLKLLRSVQRTAAIFITRSFKSVSTESLLIMSNLFPIDLKILGITALRYRLSLNKTHNFLLLRRNT